MNLLLTGVNHKTAPVSIREKIAFKSDDIPKAFELFRRFPEIRESLILSTCNRMEIYVVSGSEMNGLIPECLGEFHNVPPEAFINHLYIKEGAEAARHLFHVTSGLDSLVLGEDQILSQVKQHFRLAQESKSLGTLLHRLVQTAIEAGKRIRHETALGENPSSIGKAAVELAIQIFGDLKGKEVLILGTGEMGQLVLQSLKKRGVANPMVANRTFEKAKEIAENVNGIAYPMNELEIPLQKADIVVAATGAATPILTKSTLEPIMKERRNAPLFIIDIAVPRDVDESASHLDNLFLYNIDDLQKIVEKSNSALQKEMGKANKILEEELVRFHTWQDSLQLVPTIKALTDKIEKIKSKELERILGKFPLLDQRQKKAFENLAHALTNKILHHPLTQLKAYANHPLEADYLQVIRDLFDLKDKNE